MFSRRSKGHLLLSALVLAPVCFPQTATLAQQEVDFSIRNFRFQSGETLDLLRLHYTTLGHPHRDASGRVTNAVVIIHGTGGTGHQFLSPQFRDVLFQPGQLLDAERYFIVLPDAIGHGGSSKPSDGLHARFPHYDYTDMVTASHRLLTEGLNVNHLRLVMGTSMGCMHSFVWGEMYPDEMDALLPLACLPVPIAGRNRLWRQELTACIRTDPSWRNGEYTQQPQGLQCAIDLLLIAGGAPRYMQKTLDTPQKANDYLATQMKSRMASTDANDLLYQIDSSRTYDPSKHLEDIRAPLTLINSADDFINPPDLGIAEKEITRVKNGRFVLLPTTAETRGHGTHTLPAIWKQYLAELLGRSETNSADARRE